ncbi:hypothetical protein B7463_g3463, partial [Scytalidium lignicola]
MAFARSASGPGGLSINTTSANSLLGSGSTAPATAGMFGNTTNKPSTGLFGSTAPTSTPQSGGLFGAPTALATSQPQTGGLFGTATATSSQPQTGGLFGSTVSAQPQAGGLFGAAPVTGASGTTTSQSAQTGGLFGAQPATNQPQQAAGGFFGASSATQPTQSGGLFGGLNAQNQTKPTGTSSLFGGLGKQNQPASQPTTLFGGSTLGGGLTMGQSTNQQNQTVPGVRIDTANIRSTTRFNDLHEDLQKEIIAIDDMIQGQIKLNNECEAIIPSHGSQLSNIPNDVDFVTRKITGVENALESDAEAIAHLRNLVKADAENAKLSFKAIDNLKLPPQYHNTGIWSTKSTTPGGQSSVEAESQNLVGLFSTAADELSTTLAKYQSNITEIEQHLRIVEANSAQQINTLISRRSGGANGQENPVQELADTLREFEQSILGVASDVGALREGVQSLRLGGFVGNTNVIDFGMGVGCFGLHTLDTTREQFSACLDLQNRVPPEAKLPTSDFLAHSYTPRMDELNGNTKDITPHEYALLNGLALNYLSSSVPSAHLRELQKNIPPTSDNQDLDQVTITHPSISPDVDPYLTVSREVLTLLTSIEKANCDPDNLDDFVLPLLEESIVRRSRIDSPLLRSDHEADYREFACKHDFEIDLADIKLPMEIVDEDKNEGLIWPSRYANLSFGIIEDLKEEKIIVMRDTLRYLQTTLKVVYNKEDGKSFWEGETRYQKCHDLEPVTPLLQPTCRSPSPYEPSSPLCDIPLLSDPPSLTKEDLCMIEEEILCEDDPTSIYCTTHKGQTWNTPPKDSSNEALPKLGNIYSPLVSLDNSSSPKTDDARMKKRDLKIEPLLTPPPLPHILSKTVTFNDVVEQTLLDPWASCSPETDMPTFFEEAFGDIAEMVNRQAEQERLIEADTLGRVNIPVMDFSTPNPPWMMFQDCKNTTTLMKMQRHLIQSSISKIPSEWIATIPPVSLRWNPFRHDLAKVAITEDFGGENDTQKSYVGIDNVDSVIESSDQAWKPSGLRILKEEESEDDELEAAIFETHIMPDMSYLIKKRKAEIEQGTTDSNPATVKQIFTMIKDSTVNTSESNANRALIQDSLSKKQEKNPLDPGCSISAAHKLKTNQSTDTKGSIRGAFSPINALDSFLELRGAKRQKLTSSAYFAPLGTGQSMKDTSKYSIRTPGQTQNIPLKSCAPLPIPNIPMPSSTPITIIVSSNILKQNRPLLKRISSSLISLNIVEREFHRFSTVSRDPIIGPSVTSSLSSEADFIISPSVGLILTTLQKIKQKPLPGQKSKSAILDRLERASLKYEKLIVLVSEARDDEITKGLEEHSCLAYAELVAFTHNLDADFMVYFVGGGQETLSKWIVSSILQHRLVGEDNREIPLLEEETHWELFLRRAGMNCFAAQLIIAQLESLENVETSYHSSSGSSGIIAFVKMTKEERIAMFESMLGGKRVLNRVSDVIDAAWN